MTDSESWDWGACAELVVCTLVRHVVSACEWGDMLAGTLVYRHGPRTGTELLAGFADRTFVAAFPLSVSQRDVSISAAESWHYVSVWDH